MISTYSWNDAGTPIAPTVPLRALQLPLEFGQPNLVLGALLRSSESSICHLDLGEVVMTAEHLARIAPEVKTALGTIAPQLATFKAILDFRSWGMRSSHTSSDFLAAALAALRDVKEVALGILGFSFATVLTDLQPLLHLHTLFIGHSKLEARASQAPFRQCTSQTAIDYLNGAVALKSLTLPRQLKEVWTKDELKRVKAASKKRGVRFELA